MPAVTGQAPIPQRGDIIRDLRIENGWSQRELAERIKRKQTLISRIETEDRPACPRTISKLAREFGVPRTKLLRESVGEVAA